MRSSCVYASPGLLTAAAVLLLAAPAAAHHSFAMFDSTNKTTITGTVTRFEWTNPHVFIELDVPGSNGEVKHWSVELGSPSILMEVLSCEGGPEDHRHRQPPAGRPARRDAVPADARRRQHARQRWAAASGPGGAVRTAR